MRLIPGVAIFYVVLVSIDTDANGVISEVEQRAYAERVQLDVSLNANGTRLHLQLMSSKFSNIETLKEGLGEIQLQFDADVPRKETQLKLVLANRHQSAISAYLVNSLVPGDEAIRITAQRRSYDQSSYELEYADGSSSSTSAFSRAWSAPWGWVDTVGLLLLNGVAFAMWRRSQVTITGRRRITATPLQGRR